MLKPVKSGIYHLLHPKMAFFLTSVSKKGKPNVMTCAWATPVSEEPPMVLVAVSKESYTAKLIKETKEFVINIPTKKLLKELWICGTSSGRDTDKFKKAGLKTSKAKKVKPPLIKDCIGHIECKLLKAVDTGECFTFIGEVMAAYADERFMGKGLWAEGAGIPLHLGGKRIVYFGK